MKSVYTWFYVIGAASIALLANSISAIWARQDDKLTLWIIPLLVISPIVFITFGLTTSKLGVTVSSGAVDSLLTVSTIMVGLILFQEWNKISTFQYLGIALALCGIFLMLFFPKAGN